jgi:hypothetical protein
MFSECWKCHFRHPNSKIFSGEHAPGAPYIGSSWLRHEIFKSISRTKSAKGWQLCIRSSYVLKFDAQIAANGVSGVYISKHFRGGLPPDPPRMSHAFGARLHDHSHDAQIYSPHYLLWLMKFVVCSSILCPKRGFGC